VRIAVIGAGAMGSVFGARLRSVAIPATSRSVEIARHARERIAPHLDEAALEAAARRERAARP